MDSRQVGEVGDVSRIVKDYTITDEDYKELIREARNLPEGADAFKLIASYLPEGS